MRRRDRQRPRRPDRLRRPELRRHRQLPREHAGALRRRDRQRPRRPDRLRRPELRRHRQLPGNTPARCADGIDNDLDGLIDCADPSCTGIVSCPENTPARCADGIDNDCDGLIDCADPGCAGVVSCPENTDMRSAPTGSTTTATASSTAPTPIAAVSRHGEHRHDMHGRAGQRLRRLRRLPGLELPRQGGEAPTATCHDGIDNDCDGLIDCLDPDCSSFSGFVESICGDVIDNDCDGLIDCDDPDCYYAWECYYTGCDPNSCASDPCNCCSCQGSRVSAARLRSAGTATANRISSEGGRASWPGHLRRDDRVRAHAYRDGPREYRRRPNAKQSDRLARQCRRRVSSTDHGYSGPLLMEPRESAAATREARRGLRRCGEGLQRTSTPRADTVASEARWRPPDFVPPWPASRGSSPDRPGPPPAPTALREAQPRTGIP